MGTFAKATGSAMRLAGSALQGKSVFVSGEILNARIATCKAHSESCYDSRWGRCRECNCIIHLKARLVTESCPKQFWPEIK